jgi:hypothetical protein
VKLITNEEIARLAELESKATPGEWEPQQYCADSSYFDINASGIRVVDSDGTSERNAEFIAESRNALPRLLDSVRRLKEALEIAKSWMDCGYQEQAFDADMARIRDLVGE